MSIHEYNIIESIDKQTVIDAVNSDLRQGWEPYGDLCMTPVLINNKTAVRYAQALVRTSTNFSKYG